MLHNTKSTIATTARTDDLATTIAGNMFHLAVGPTALM
jgi:hypothetical protein